MRAVAEEGKRAPIEVTPPVFERLGAASTETESPDVDADLNLNRLVSAQADYSPPPQKRQKTSDLP